jgi:hypothetical protein
MPDLGDGMAPCFLSPDFIWLCSSPDLDSGIWCPSNLLVSVFQDGFFIFEDVTMPHFVWPCTPAFLSFPSASSSLLGVDLAETAVH